MTLSFNILGNYGHIGNQMFQYASLMGIALSNDVDYVIPPKEVFGTQYPTRSSIDDCFNITCERKITNFKNYFEKSFSFESELMGGIEHDLNLHGYFQSEKYFLKYRKEIKKEFTFKEQILNASLEFASQFPNLISLHIRRTDYVGNSNHPMPSLTEYYQKALKTIDDSIPVLIFSDDPKWCKEQSIFAGDRFLVSENDPYTDLCIMTLCTHHIIANSSFSWWGAWLSESKEVFAPKNWFGGQAVNNNTSDLYCSNWRIL